MPQEATPSRWTNATVRAVLRSPDLDALIDDDLGFRTPDGSRFPVVDQGAAVRALDSRAMTRRPGELLGFGLYKWLRNTLFSRRELPDGLLRAKYGNLFLEHQVYFFTAAEIESLWAKHHVQVESASRQGATHRMHCHVVRKLA